MEITIKTADEELAKRILEAFENDDKGYTYTMKREVDDLTDDHNVYPKEYTFTKDFYFGNGIENFKSKDIDAEEDDDEVEENYPEPEKRFGAGFEIDEPRACDYEYRGDFLYAHELFDKFVEAGEACVKAGLERKGCGPITKVDAIKTNIGDLPPIGIELMGETQWECE